MAKRVGYKGPVQRQRGRHTGQAELDISTMEDVFTDARSLVEATRLPLLVDTDIGWGEADGVVVVQGAHSQFRALRQFAYGQLHGVSLDSAVATVRFDFA